MRRFAIPCIECGQLTKNEGGKCSTHKRLYEQQQELRRSLVKKLTGQYSGDYRKRAKAVRDNALECHLCGRGALPNDPWEADHIDPADPKSELAAAHRSCNLRRGNKLL
jgi:5-methylcytosine-specific restriction endonuclease McrA